MELWLDARSDTGVIYCRLLCVVLSVCYDSILFKVPLLALIKALKTNLHSYITHIYTFFP